MLGDIIHTIDDFGYFLRDTIFIMIIFSVLFEKRIFKNNRIFYALTVLATGLVFRQIHAWLLKLTTNRDSIRRINDVFPLQENGSYIQPLLLLIYALLIGTLLTTAKLYYLIILSLFYIPVRTLLHPLAYTISRLWPDNVLPSWHMVYVIRAIAILLLSSLLTWLLILLGAQLKKTTDSVLLWSITVTAVGLNILAVYLQHLMDSMYVLNITYTLLVLISMLLFLLIGEISRHREEYQRLSFQKEIEDSYRNYIFELEEMSNQIRLFRHEYQGKILLLKSLLDKKDLTALDEHLNDMLEAIPTAEQLVTSGNYDFDVIVNRKLSEIKAHDIALQVHISIPDKLPYLTEDLFSLINNVMNNAMEAAAATVNPKIFLDAHTAKNYFILTVQNSCKENVLEINPDLFTTKSNSQYHGYGIPMIRQIVEKYNGILDFSGTGSSFQCRILLPLEF